MCSNVGGGRAVPVTATSQDAPRSSHPTSSSPRQRSSPRPPTTRSRPSPPSSTSSAYDPMRTSSPPAAAVRCTPPRRRRGRHPGCRGRSSVPALCGMTTLLDVERRGAHGCGGRREADRETARARWSMTPRAPARRCGARRARPRRGPRRRRAVCGLPSQVDLELVASRAAVDASPVPPSLRTWSAPVAARAACRCRRSSRAKSSPGPPSKWSSASSPRVSAEYSSQAFITRSSPPARPRSGPRRRGRRAGRGPRCRASGRRAPEPSSSTTGPTRGCELCARPRCRCPRRPRCRRPGRR